MRNDVVRVRLQVRPLADNAHTDCRYQIAAATTAASTRSANGPVPHLVSKLCRLSPRWSAPGMVFMAATRPAYRGRPDAPIRHHGHLLGICGHDHGPGWPEVGLDHGLAWSGDGRGGRTMVVRTKRR